MWGCENEAKADLETQEGRGASHTQRLLRAATGSVQNLPEKAQVAYRSSEALGSPPLATACLRCWAWSYWIHGFSLSLVQPLPVVFVYLPFGIRTFACACPTIVLRVCAIWILILTEWNSP